jgi:hypothetical protein
MKIIEESPDKIKVYGLGRRVAKDKRLHDKWAQKLKAWPTIEEDGQMKMAQLGALSA